MAQAEMEKIFDVEAGKYFHAVSNYEKYPEFVDGMKKVTIERQSNGKYLGHYLFSMMGKDMSYDLEIEDSAEKGTVNWKLLKSEFFKVNNGAWKIEEAGPGQCKVYYSLEVEFSFSVPGLILKGLVKGTLPSMMKSFYERAKEL